MRANDLVREDIHLLDPGTASRALSALVTFHEVLTADRLNLLHEIVVQRLFTQFDPNGYSSREGWIPMIWDGLWCFLL